MSVKRSSTSCLHVSTKAKEAPGWFHVCFSVHPECHFFQFYFLTIRKASPGLGQGTLVLYAYEIGSQFDFQMNYYMTTPDGINPARLGVQLDLANVSSSAVADLTQASVPGSAALDVL